MLLTILLFQQFKILLHSAQFLVYIIYLYFIYLHQTVHIFYLTFHLVVNPIILPRTHLSVYQSFYLSINPYIYLSFTHHLSIYLSKHHSFLHIISVCCPSVYHPSICLSFTHSSICLSLTHTSVRLFVRLSNKLFIITSVSQSVSHSKQIDGWIDIWMNVIRPSSIYQFIHLSMICPFIYLSQLNILYLFYYSLYYQIFVFKVSFSSML